MLFNSCACNSIVEIDVLCCVGCFGVFPDDDRDGDDDDDGSDSEGRSVAGVASGGGGVIVVAEIKWGG